MLVSGATVVAVLAECLITGETEHPNLQAILNAVGPFSEGWQVFVPA